MCQKKKRLLNEMMYFLHYCITPKLDLCYPLIDNLCVTGYHIGIRVSRVADSYLNSNEKNINLQNIIM